MIVDEDNGTVNTLSEVLKTKGYIVTESNGKELMVNAVANQPDIIIMNSVLSENQEVVKSLRFEKALKMFCSLFINKNLNPALWQKNTNSRR